MLKKLIIIVSLLGTAAIPLTAQVNWSASLGGGMSYLNDYFENNYLYNYQEDFLLEGGLLVHSSFREQGMLGWGTGLLLQYSGFRDIPFDRDAIPGSGGISEDNIQWDWENSQRIRNWSLKVPVSLMFNVFEPIGIKFGGHLNYMLSTGLENRSDISYKTWIPGIHLGLYAPLGSRIRLTGQVSSDISPRFTGIGQPLAPDFNYRELSFSLQINYKLNP